MTYTPKTKRPTVKSLMDGYKRLQAELKATQELLDDETNVRASMVRELSTIAELADKGNKFGHRKETLSYIRQRAVVHAK